MADVQLSTLGSAIKTALSDLTGSARLSASAITGLTAPATAAFGTGSGDVAEGDHGHSIEDIEGLDAALAASGAVVSVNGMAGVVELDAAAVGAEKQQVVISWATGARDLAATDDRGYIAASHGAPVLTIRSQADVGYLSDMVVTGSGVSGLTISPASGVTINGASDPVTVLPESQNGGFVLRRRATNDWRIWVGGDEDGDFVSQAEFDAAISDTASAEQGLLAASAVQPDALAGMLYSEDEPPEVPSLVRMAGDGTLKVITTPESKVVTVPSTYWRFGEDGRPESVSPEDVRSDIGAAPAVADAGAFWAYGADGIGAAMQPADAWVMMQAGRPFETRTVNFASNILTFDADSGRRVMTNELAGNSTIAASCWDGIREGDEGVELFVPIGATAYTLTAETGDDGLYAGANPEFAPGSVQEFRLFRLNGSPAFRWAGSFGGAAAVAARAQYIGLAVDNSATEVTPPDHQAGDLLVAIAYRNGASSLPTMPDGWTDEGVGADGMAPVFRIATKVAASSSETCSGWSQVNTLACFVFRKAGGTPQIDARTLSKNGYSASTPIPWAEISPSSRGLVVAMLMLQSTDRADPADPIRDGVTLIGSEVGDETAISTNSGGHVYAGISSLVDSLPADTSTKINGTGRSISFQFSVI